MKIKKNVNMNSLVARLGELSDHATTVANDFKRAIQIFDDVKLGVTELDYRIDEEVMRLKHAYAKVEDLLKGL